LRAVFASGSCELSIAELAERYVSPADATPKRRKNDERQVQRALALIRRTYGERFVEQRRHERRLTRTVRRWIAPPASSSSRGEAVDLDLSDLLTDQRSSRAKADRARARAPRIARPHRPRRPARPHGVTNPAILAPVALEAGVIDAVRAAHGPRAAWHLVRELQRPRCHAYADEARLAARTLAVRATDTPLRLFRHLFRKAIGGDPLIDKRDQIARTVRAELEGMLGPPDVPAEERLEELEQRLAAVHASGGDPERVVELERAIRALRGPPSRTFEHHGGVVRPPLTRSLEPEPLERKPDPARGAAFIRSLPSHLRADFLAEDTS
jgi:hypothetical protein